MRPLSFWAHALALTLHVGLIIGLTAASRSPLGLLFALLLFLPLPGLLRGLPRTHAWASMMLAFYCAGLLSNVYDEPARRGIMLLLAVMAALEFAALVLYVRFGARERQAREARGNS